MTNQVDTSKETIDREWARIQREHEATPEPSQSGNGPALNFEEVEGVHIEGSSLPGQPNNAATMEEKIAMAKVVISGALVFVFDALGGLSVPDDKYDRVAHSWAVVIAKRFEGGIFDFLAKYKDEIAAVGATLVFIKAVRIAAEEKAKKEAAERREKAMKKAVADPEKTKGEPDGSNGRDAA